MIDTLAQLADWSDTRGRWPIRLAAVAMLSAIAAMTAYIGIVHCNSYKGDIFGLLDGGWRISNGQLPYRDYFPGIGVLQDYRTAFDLWLGHGRPEGMAYGNAILCVVLGLWTFFLLETRMNRLMALVVVKAVALLIVCPSPLGFQVLDFSRAMEYNRLGYALCGIVMLIAFQPPFENSARWREIVSMLSCGVLLALSAFIKPTYFAVGAGAVVLALLLGYLDLRRFAWIAGTAGVLVGAGVAVFGLGRIVDVYRQFQGTSISNYRLDPVRIAGKAVLWQTNFWALLCGGYYFARTRGLLLGAFAFAAGLGILTTNGQDAGFPLTALVLIMFSGAALEELRKQRAALSAAVALWALIFAMPGIVQDGMSLLLAAHEKRGHDVEREDILQGAPGRILIFDDSAEWVAFLNDGARLLEQSSAPKECVATIGFANYYSYLLARPPCAGGNPYATPAPFLGRADVVMAPKKGSPYGKKDEDLVAHFAPELSRDYVPAGESQSWRMYRRR